LKQECINEKNHFYTPRNNAIHVRNSPTSSVSVCVCGRGCSWIVWLILQARLHEFIPSPVAGNVTGTVSDTGVDTDVDTNPGTGEDMGMGTGTAASAPADDSAAMGSISVHVLSAALVLLLAMLLT
jgi:hypothetical protein